MARIIRIHALFTDRIEAVGGVRRIYFHSFVTMDDHTERWLYFGTDPTDPGREPTTADPIYEYNYIQFPQAMDDVGVEGSAALFQIGMIAGYRREGYEGY